MAPDELQDLLSDLQHDLGKYLRLPVALLPPGADQRQLRAALGDALLRTQRGPSGVLPARALWARFEAELAEALGSEQLGPLRAAVARALAWEAALRRDEPIDRAQLWQDLQGVGDAIQALAGALNGEDDSVQDGV